MKDNSRTEILLEEVQSDIKLILEVVGSHTNSIKHIETDITGMKADITDMKTDITGMKADITEIRGDITEIRGELGEMNDRLDRIEYKVSEQDDIKATLAEHSVEIEDLKLLKKQVV